jgi:predicted Rossmann-fold nucleotide-binding protein
MNQELIHRIRQEQGTPLIGVIGATNPSEEYRSEIGIKVGYELRTFIEEKKGGIFTGGVEGVGIDVYVGVMRNCLENNHVSSLNGKKFGFNDRFFILVPTFEYGAIPSTGFLPSLVARASQQPVPYVPPGEYSGLGSLSAKGKLNVVRAGQNMGERREYVAGVADALVVVNGGFGTLDEAINAALLNVPLIALRNSGGAASTLAAVKEGKISKSLAAKAGMHGLDLGVINPDLVNICEDAEELSTLLRRIFKS